MTVEEVTVHLGTWEVSTFVPVGPRAYASIPVAASVGADLGDDVALFRLPDGVLIKLASEVVKDGWPPGDDAVLDVSTVDEPANGTAEIYVGLSALEALGVHHGYRVAAFDTAEGVLLRPASVIEGGD